MFAQWMLFFQSPQIPIFPSGSRFCPGSNVLAPSYGEAIKVYSQDVFQTGAQERITFLCSCHDADLLAAMSSALQKGQAEQTEMMTLVWSHMTDQVIQIIFHIEKQIQKF